MSSVQATSYRGDRRSRVDATDVEGREPSRSPWRTEHSTASRHAAKKPHGPEPPALSDAVQRMGPEAAGDGRDEEAGAIA
jgi:hypothetical protein